MYFNSYKIFNNHMAIIDEGILGGFRGKIGTIVGVSNKGAFYMRSLPKARKRSTHKELINQAKFKAVLNHLEPLKELVRAGFKDHYTRTGGYRAAFAYNRKHAVAGNEGAFHIDPALFRISGGDLPGAGDPAVNVEDGQLEITWHNAGLDSDRNPDQMMVLVYDPINSRALTRIFDGAYRSAESFAMEIPADMLAAEVDIYIGFTAADRSAQSDSQYLGRFAL
jgi:hypothetical protein